MNKQLLCRGIFTMLLALSSIFASAQNISGKVVDAKTGESIPFANIIIGSENLITNEEGAFSLSDSKYNDDSTLDVTYMGYGGKRLTIASLKSSGNIVRLEPGLYELKSVNVKKPDANQIISEVKKNLARNYKQTEASRNMLFLRESSTFRPIVFDFEIKKSTGFTKKDLASANKQLGSFTMNLVRQPVLSFNDMLLNYYTNVSTGPTPAAPKVEVIKATKLLDEKRSGSMEDLDKVAINILLKHLDTLKYYRVKSGMIGSRDTVSLRKDFQTQKKKNKPKKTALTSAKKRVDDFFRDSSFEQSKTLDFIKQSDIYEYTYEGATMNGDNDLVYVLNFKPRKRKAIYTGKLYISEADYAILRADYTLAEGKRVSGVNVKWLLGIKTSENLSKGTLIYKKKSTTDDYYLHYGSIVSGQYFYVNRPLKFIELTNEKEEDVVALEFKIEANVSEKTEMLNISRDEISNSDFANASEKEFTYIPIKRYDPEIWKDYTAIEPLAEMKGFKVVE